MNLIDKIKYRIEVRQEMIKYFEDDLKRGERDNDPALRESSRQNIYTSERILDELNHLLEVK